MHSPMSGSPFGNPLQDDAPLGAGHAPVDADSRQTAMLIHLLGLLTGFLGPLVLWLVKKDQSKFIDFHGKEALNFQLTLLIAYLVSGVVWFIIGFITCGFGIIVPIPLAITVVQIVFGVIACTKANAGEWYRYPMTLRMVT